MSDGFAGVVLAAGLGTRLRPLTELLPKAMCPVDNVPLVDLALGHVGAVTPEIAVNVHAHREAMEAHLAGSGVHLSVEEDEVLGTAGAIGNLRDWIDGRPVLVHNADAWHRGDLERTLVRGWDGERLRLLVVHDPPLADFGRWRYAGVCLLPWRDVSTLEPVPSGLYEVSWREAEAEERLDFAVHEEPWFDTGTPSDYLAANLAASGGATVVAPDADVRGEAVRSVVWSGAEVAEHERLFEQVRAPGGLTVDAPQ